jgi:hypothetical protein
MNEEKIAQNAPLDITHVIQEMNHIPLPEEQDEKFQSK